MADKILNVRVQSKYDTEANWKEKDPVLLKGEQAFTSDGSNKNKYKIGDGTSKWSALTYAKADLSKGDVTTALGYTPPTSNTWRGIQNNLTSDSTTDSLAAAQGKVLKGLVDGKLPLSGGTMTGPVKWNGSDSLPQFPSAPTYLVGIDAFASGGTMKWQLAEKVNVGSANSAPWSGITGKPSTYPPSSHTHNYAGSSSPGGIANSANGLYVNPSTRPTSANYDLTNNAYAYRVTYSIASSAMTTGKPPKDAHILTFGWDSNAGWGSQLAIGDSEGCNLYLRGCKSVTTDGKNTSVWESSWRTVLDSGNYTNYAAAKDHTHDLSTMINTLTTGTAAPTDNDYYISQYAGGGTTYTSYHRRTHSALWTYIKTKADSVYQAKGNYATAGHTHSYAGSSSSGGSATSAVKLDSSAGSATQPVYFSGGKPVACTYTLGKSVPSNAVFTDTNTWRGIQDNLTSTSTTDSLSAKQGKVLNDGKLGAVSANGYYGMTRPDGNTTDWIRTSSSGLLPYQSGQINNGHSSVGHKDWYFSSSYIDHMYSMDVSIASAVKLQYDSTNQCLNFVFL